MTRFPTLALTCGYQLGWVDQTFGMKKIKRFEICFNILDFLYNTTIVFACFTVNIAWNIYSVRKVPTNDLALAHLQAAIWLDVGAVTSLCADGRRMHGGYIDRHCSSNGVWHVRMYNWMHCACKKKSIYIYSRSLYLPFTFILRLGIKKIHWRHMASLALA
jgi:hypothetical protein